MCKEGRVEVKPNSLLMAPEDPRFKVGEFIFIAAGRTTIEIGVKGVEVKSFRAGYEGESHFQVLAKFRDRPSPAWVIAGGFDTAVFNAGLGVFKAADIVALPTLDADGCVGERLESSFGINA